MPDRGVVHHELRDPLGGPHDVRRAHGRVGRNADEVLRSVRRIRPTLPVMVISGNVGREQRTELDQLGAGDVIVKPYSLTDVGRRLRNLLDKSKARG